jgi:chemotaxis-related protein WspB
MLLLIFRVAEGWYAVEADRVVEVVPRIDLRAVPHATEALAGLFRYRGKVVPVVDLGLLMGGSACRPRLSTRIIVVDAAARGSKPGEPAWLGLVAEQVNDVRKVSEDEVTAAPMRLDRAPYLGSIVQSRDQIIQLIDVDRILTGSLRTAWLGGPSEAT